MAGTNDFALAVLKPNRKNAVEKRHAKIATEAGVHLVGDYGQRRTGATPDGKWACFEFRNTNRFRGFPYIWIKCRNIKRIIEKGWGLRRRKGFRRTQRF